MKFHKDFLFGFSEAGFQFEMGYPGLEDPNSDWWIWVHSTDNIASGIVSGDLPEAGPAYLALFRKDHELAQGLGANVLRLGVEWSRIFPKPTRDIKIEVEKDDSGVISNIDIKESTLEQLVSRVNKQAVEQYRALFMDWIDRGGKLIINLNHFTLPSWIHDPIEVRRKGVDRAPAGWLSEEIIIEFAKYVAVVAHLFGDIPEMWSTLNEPNVVAINGYLLTASGFPPSVPSVEYSITAMRNMAIAHARAYDILREYTSKPVGIIVNFMWIEPLDPESERDKQASNNVSYFYNHMILDTITNGSSMLASSNALKNKLDWIGVNYYTRMVVKHSDTGWKPIPGYGFICNPNGISKDERPCSDFGWELYPEGLEHILLTLHERYRRPMFVTENGIADRSDHLRPRYLIEHIASVLRALSKGVDVRGYLHWALIDNYEWAKGFSMRFGLIKVDFESKKRRLRPSALLFREIATRKEIPEELFYL